MHDRAAAADILRPYRERLVGLELVAPPVVVGVSGGPDSLALLALLHATGLDPVAVHVDHGLRPGSEREAHVVAAYAGTLDVAFRAEQVDVGVGPNVEARARAARYEALERVRASSRATIVAVGHTADDQAETVLLNLLRGSASAGLGGMQVRRGRIVRPMLELRRADTEAICAALGLEPVRDPTNEDTGLRRSWIRHEVLPMLSKGAERDLVPILARQAQILRDDSEHLDALARAAWPVGEHRPTALLGSLPPALARRAVRQWLGPPPPSAAEVERVLTVARGDAVATEVAGGRRVSRRSGELHLDR